MGDPIPAKSGRLWLRPLARRYGLVLGFVWLLCGGWLAAGETPSLETQVKAAFLIKFGKFVYWPTPAVTNAIPLPFEIGILGRDPFGQFFDAAVQKEKISGRQVRLLRSDTPAAMVGCPVVFIGDCSPRKLEELLRPLTGRPVLTVSDEPGCARRGGMIGFIKEAGKVRFEINVAAAEKAGLKFNSQLLQVARIVAPDAKPEAP